MFKLPIVDYTNGYQVAPTTKPTLVGAATLPTNEQKTKELFEMFGLRLQIDRLAQRKKVKRKLPYINGLSQFRLVQEQVPFGGAVVLVDANPGNVS